MAYVLVLLRAGPNLEDEEQHSAAHVRFIDSLIADNLVLLGGSFAAPIGDAYAGYLLRCDGREQGEAIAARDPFVVNGVLRPECVEWPLVGINPEAIDASAVITPRDVSPTA